MEGNRQFKNEYYKILHLYIDDPDEKYLFDVSELGREMVLSGFPPEELIEIHEYAVNELGKVFKPYKLVENAQLLLKPLMEIMISYGIAFREWVDASERARNALEKHYAQLEQVNLELETSRKQFSTFMYHLPALAFITDETGNNLYMNEYLKDHLSITELSDHPIMSNFSNQLSSDTINYNNKHYRMLKFPISDEGPAKLYGYLGVDITDHIQAREMMEEAKLAAEAANRSKAEFLANMSHELRTPLNSIIGFSDLLLSMDGKLDIRQKRYVGNVLSSGKHLLNLINDILDLSKIDAGKMDMYYENIQITSLVDEVCSVLRSISAKDRVHLTCNIERDLPLIQADREKLKQILFNLIGNAIKFTKAGGFVEVGARMKEDDVEIFVTDTGIGISQEDQKKLFNPFVQVDSSTSRQYQGTGLGLALVKRFVELHGGSVGLESKIDEGSTFSFTLPL